MKKPTTTKKPVDAKTRAEKIEARFGGTLKTTKVTKRELHLEAIERFKKTAPIPIIDRFSTEQRIQIRRLAADLKLETGAFGGDDETIATLAEAALYAFGLDPIAEGSYSSIARVVFENPKISLDIRSSIINEVREAGNDWTEQHRDAERKMFKGHAA